MWRKFSFKLTLAFCGTLILAMGLTGALLTQQMKKIFISELTNDLVRSADLIQTEINPKNWDKDPENLQNLVLKFGQAGRCRVTLIRRDGVVLADSSLKLSEIKGVENHRFRPEVQAALENKIGSAVRNSHTIRQDLLYVAVPLVLGADVVGAVRLALPLTEVNSKLAHLQKIIFGITLLILFIALMIALRLTRSFSLPLKEMSLAAHDIAHGNFDIKINEFSSVELNQLGETLNYLVGRVRIIIQELAKDKSQLSSVLTNMVEAVAAVDSQGRVIVINPSFSRLFGIDAERATGKSFLEVLRHNRINQSLRDTLESGKTCVEEVKTYETMEQIFELHTAPMLEGEKQSGALVVLHDITRLRRLEQVRKDFVANVSHELRTPLSSIKGFSETLRTGGLEDKEHRLGFVQSIESQADRMTRLVEDLLDLSQIESGKKTPERIALELLPLIQEVAQELKHLAKRRDITVSLVELEKLPAVTGDRKQLKQVFLNLLDNAIKFNKDAGSVIFAGRVQATTVTISVKDTGVGIPLEDLPRIFERFYRVDKARSRDLGGTGLGLSIVKHIVEAHGGSASVSSSDGKGSVFEIVFPRALA